VKRIFIVLILISTSVHAVTIDNGKQMADELVSGSQTFMPGSSVDLKDAVPAYTTSSPPQTQYNDGNMFDAATLESVDNEAAQFIKNSHDKRPDFDIDKSTSPIFTKSKTIIDNPQAVIDNLVGHYGDCDQQGGDPLFNDDIRTCDEYIEISEQSCSVGRVIEVDTDYKYKCSSKRNYSTHTCDRTLSLTCQAQGNCASGGIVLDSIATDMAWAYSGNILTIGTIADNYWSGSCAIFERTTRFTIHNLDKIHKFVLQRVGYDDYMLVKLNGQVIYNGPFGGDKLEVANIAGGRYVQYDSTNDNKYSFCELSRSWTDTLNLDLIPYLRQGSNELTIKVQVSGSGEGWLQIDSEQSCCSTWVENWTDNCGAYK